MARMSGPICARCGEIVGAVTFVPAPDDPDEEQAVCADCLAAAIPPEPGRLATILPFDPDRPRRPRRGGGLPRRSGKEAVGDDS